MSQYNEAIEFEKIVMSLYQAILNADGFENIRVEHNVTLACKSGATAQFDIYWKFKQAGVTHEVAIECKNYNKKITSDKVRDFACKLHDAGNLRGIMVSRKGYQHGTKLIAKDNGINLKIFQFPHEMDWTGRIRTVQLTIHAAFLENIRCSLELDQEWCAEHYPGVSRFSLAGMSNEILIIKEDGTPVKSLHELENALPRGETSAQNLKETITFSEPTFFSTLRDAGRRKPGSAPGNS